MVVARADVTGSVWKVLTAPGQSVHAGDELVVLESMKMEIPVVAPAGGRVDVIHVAEGDAVSEGQDILVIDETA